MEDQEIDFYKLYDDYLDSISEPVTIKCMRFVRYGCSTPSESLTVTASEVLKSVSGSGYEDGYILWIDTYYPGAR